MRPAIILLLLAACGDNIGANAYMWDDRKVLCSVKMDDLRVDVDWDEIDQQMAYAEHYQWAVIYHAHIPTKTVSLQAIDRLFTAAESHHLTPLTFRDLDEASPKGGSIVFALDDNAVDEWMLALDLLARHQAHITFFVSRYTHPAHDEIQMLASQGHDIEPHTVNHLHGPDYVDAHGLDAYLSNEVWPSFQILEDDGFPPASTFAYPFGEHTDELDSAILKRVGKVRTTMGLRACPW